jgi:hypothetical protein
MLPNVDRVVLSRWHLLFEDFSTSTQEFYIAVEDAIQRRNIPEIEVTRMYFNEGGIATAKREYLRIRRNRIAFDICSAPYGNGHFFSWWLAKVPAKYGLLIITGLLMLFFPVWSVFATLLVKVFGESCMGGFLSLVFLFAGIPIILLASGFLIERGLIGDEEWVLSTPIIGYLYLIIFNPLTYYRLDTAFMFRDSVRSAVNEVLNGLREEKGLRLLGEEELEPASVEAPRE